MFALTLRETFRKTKRFFNLNLFLSAGYLYFDP